MTSSIVTSPNNPTGDLADLGLIERVCHACHGLVMVDEAYIEFAGEDASALPLLAHLDNLVILRTLSKAYGAAGTRCGYVMAATDIIDALSAVRQIYSVNVLTQAAALALVRKRGALEPLTASIVTERARLQRALEELPGITVWPSSANFLLVRMAGATAIRNRLRDEYSILVRDFSSAAGLEDCLRITVGTPEENDAVIAALTELLPKEEPIAMTDSANRRAVVTRVTGETDITVELDLDGTGTCLIDTGVPFFDHMLNAFGRHGLFDLTVRATGDIEVDAHHTVEDTGIVLGQAFTQALGDKAGITRFSDVCIPMDETLVQAAVDISGRGQAYCDLPIPTERVGSFDTELAVEFFYAFARDARVTLHVRELARSELAPHHRGSLQGGWPRDALRLRTRPPRERRALHQGLAVREASVNEPSIVVVDYHKGNLSSVVRGLTRAGAHAFASDDPDAIASADGIVLPGVGSFYDAISYMAEHGQDRAVIEATHGGKGTPFLGICLGLQLLFERGDEGVPADAPNRPRTRPPRHGPRRPGRFSRPTGRAGCAGSPCFPAVPRGSNRRVSRFPMWAGIRCTLPSTDARAPCWRGSPRGRMSTSPTPMPSGPTLR